MAGKSDQISTIQRQQRMLKALIAYHGIVTRAAKAAGITPQTHYNWFKTDEDYQDKVNEIKIECHEEFKELVMTAVRKKIQQGNTTIIALCYKTVLLEEAQRLERLSPYKDRLKVRMKLAQPPPGHTMWSKDPFTQASVKAYEDVLQRQREGKQK